MNKLMQLLSGGDLRSIGNSESLVSAVQSQVDFDNLFALLYHPERIIVMRVADAIEKITATRPELLATHKGSIFELMKWDSRRREEFLHLLEELQKEKIPSLTARIKQLRNKT